MKQAILVRSDLKMPKGKMAAMVAHASVEAAFKTEKVILEDWKKIGMKKVILRVNSESELLSFQKKAKSVKLVTALIKDAGKTFFKKPTITCLAIGPNSDLEINKVTGKLKLIN